MESPEDHTETVKEHIRHEAMHKSNEKQIMTYAITSAIYAIFAATASLLAGYHSNESIVEQMKSSDQWSYYQAKSIKMNVAETKLEILKAINPHFSDEKILNKIESYKNEIKEISQIAKEKEVLSEQHLLKHISFSRSVTLFQVAIGMTAFAILIKRKRFWYLSIGFGFVGLGFLIFGFSS